MEAVSVKLAAEHQVRVCPGFLPAVP